MTHTLVYPITSSHNAAGHLEIDGCDVVELGSNLRHAAGGLRGDLHPRPVPPLHERVRGTYPGFRDHLREQSVLRRGDRPDGPRGGPVDRRIFGRRVSRGQGGRLPGGEDLLPRQQQDPGRTRVRPFRRCGLRGGRQLPGTGFARRAGGGAGRAAEGTAAHHAGHRGAHPLLHPDRAGGLQVRVRPGGWGGHGGHPAGDGSPASRADRSARPHRQPDLRAGVVPQSHRHPGGPHRAGRREPTGSSAATSTSGAGWVSATPRKTPRRPSATTRPSRWRA